MTFLSSPLRPPGLAWSSKEGPCLPRYKRMMYHRPQSPPRAKMSCENWRFLLCECLAPLSFDNKKLPWLQNSFKMHKRFCQVQQKVADWPTKKPESWKYVCLQMNPREQRLTLCCHHFITWLDKIPGTRTRLWPVRTSGISINLS